MTASAWRLSAAAAVSCSALVLGGSALGACAADGDEARDEPGANAVIPAPDASTDDASGDAEPGACNGDDCAFFPAACTPDVLCPNGPFDPADPERGMDWRTRINVIRGRSASDVWVAGAVGAMAHFDGTSWTTSDVGTMESLRALWLRGVGEISFASLQRVYGRGVGAGGADASTSAGGWALFDAPRLPYDFGGAVTASWADPGADVAWLASDTTLWRMQLTPEAKVEILPGVPSDACYVMPCNRVLSIHGASTRTLWAVGELGAAFRVGDADTDAPTATQLNSQTHVGLTGVWAASDTDVWAVGGSGTIRHYVGDPLQWDVVAGVPTTENLNAVWGSSSSDVWAVGNGGVVLHYDGAGWTRVKIAGLGERRPDLFAVWSPAPGRVWVGGYGVVLALGGQP